MLQNEKGLTLIELLAALAILSLVVISYLNISGYSALANQKSDSKTEALRIAEQTINGIRKQITSIEPIKSEPTEANMESLLAAYRGPYEQNNKYQVYAQQTDFVGSPPYDTSSFEKNKVSVQAIILYKNDNNSFQPRLLTVTVSWGD